MAATSPSTCRAGSTWCFSYDVATHVLTVQHARGRSHPRPDPGEGAVAATRPARLGRARRRHAPLPPALVGCRRPGRGRRGRHRWFLGAAAPRPGRAAARRAGRLPAPRGLRGFRLRAQDLAKVPQILHGQLAVASYDPSGALLRRDRGAGARRPRRRLRRRRVADPRGLVEQGAADGHRVGADRPGRRPEALAHPGRRAHRRDGAARRRDLVGVRAAVVDGSEPTSTTCGCGPPPPAPWSATRSPTPTPWP